MDEQMQKVISYQIAMSLARSMLLQQLISEEEYRIIDTIMADKYGLSSCSIYRNSAPN